jgi:hypothetical protein
MPTRALATAATVVVLALTAAPALARAHFTHTVVPCRSIAGVTLKSAPAQIRAGKGPGCNISRGEAGAPGSAETSFSTGNGKVDGFVVSDTFNDN